MLAATSTSISILSYTLFLRFLHYIYDLYSHYTNFFEYLNEMPNVEYKDGYLRKGMWICRSMERGYWNIYPLIYTHHHGVMIDDTNVAHFQDNKIKVSSLKEFMNTERILNVLMYNPLFEYNEDDAKNWDGKYNLIYNNCEHYASLLIEGKSRSRQMEVLEWLAYNLPFGRKDIPLDKKIIPIERYFCNM